MEPESERRESLLQQEIRVQALLYFPGTQIWPLVPESARRRLSKTEEEAILSYGEFGEPA